MTVQSGLVPLLDEETGRFPDEFAPPSVAADAAAAHDATEAAGRAQEAAEAAENNAAEHEREAGQIVEDATATIPGLISEQVTAQIDPKVAAATQAKEDAETARGAAQTARDDALQAKAQAVAAQEAAAGSAGAAATSAEAAAADAERAEVAAGQATAPAQEMVDQAVAGAVPPAVAQEVADATKVQQVTLTAPLAYALPVGTPANTVHRVTFTQDATGGHTVTYDDQPVAVDLTVGATTIVEIWPDGAIAYPSASPVSVLDNGDGTYSLIGTAITDNLNGTLTIGA